MVVLVFPFCSLSVPENSVPGRQLWPVIWLAPQLHNTSWGYGVSTYDSSVLGHLKIRRRLGFSWAGPPASVRLSKIQTSRAPSSVSLLVANVKEVAGS